MLTGSAAMAAEATHSVADTCNEMLLYVGLRQGARPADDRHPFGHGQARYFWSLLAAVGPPAAARRGRCPPRRPRRACRRLVGPTATAVFLEDSAALIGLALALAALLLHLVTGSAVWDGAASLLIGLLLIVVAYLLIRRNAALLIDEAPPADIRERLRRRLLTLPAIAAVEVTPVGRAT